MKYIIDILDAFFSIQITPNLKLYNLILGGTYEQRFYEKI